MTPRILIAGVGNIFRGDDAFGVEVVRRIADRALPVGVTVRDFGIRGHDLAYALLEDYRGLILIDAINRDTEPGTLHVLELTPEEWKIPPATMQTHGVDLPNAFYLLKSLGGTFPRLYLVGCEPAELGPEDEGVMGLSEPVQAAIAEAITLVESLVAELRRA
ncbi:MAG: hydrogenase maturation protease [Planctomycetia bacterium]|nr:hydrogenase maturation protease [Planctomycetia bacterium]